MSLRQRVRAYKLDLMNSARDLSAPGARRRAWVHFLIFDHAILRVLWSNFAKVAPGVFRANHPAPKRLKRYADMGIKTILNLRGASEDPHYQLEREACEANGLTLVDMSGLVARQAPERDALLAVLDAMRRVEKPVLMHCKSGADRTSLAAGLYLLAEENAPVAVARKQFSVRFIHFKWTKTGVLDHILDTYEAAQQSTGIGFEDWLRTEYDAATVQASFEARRA